MKDEAVGVVVDNNGQGLITIDDFAQLNEKYVEGLFLFYKDLERLQGGVQSWGCSIRNI